jgi:hypothetical protein
MKCSGPLCPLDEESLAEAVWFSSEDICTAKRGKWITAQKKIAKKSKDDDTYYTLGMLKQDCVIGSAIKGLSPERDHEEQLAAWLKKHPTKRSLTEEEREEKRRLFLKRIGS